MTTLLLAVSLLNALAATDQAGRAQTDPSSVFELKYRGLSGSFRPTSHVTSRATATA